MEIFGISSIFANMYNETLDKILFKFELIYTINEMDIKVSKKQKLIYKSKQINNTSWKTLQKLYSLGGRLPARLPITLGEPYDYRPSQVIALYSGEELRLWENYYRDPYLKYNELSLRGDSYLSKLNMLYINKYYWDIALLTMFASDMDNDEKISEIAGAKLKNVKLEINIKLLDDFLQTKPNNEVNIFVQNFKNLNSSMISLDEFKEKSEYKTHIELFKLLCVARLPKDLKNKLITDLELFFDNDTTTKDFSEGQKKQILLKLCLEVLFDENSLMLLDEPDVHIHIANKKLIPNILKGHTNREIILTTHSPTLMNIFDKNLEYLENGKIEGKQKAEILKEISGDTMSIAEQQIVLNSNNDILLVEGKSDIIFLKKALECLNDTRYERLKAIEYVPTGGASGLKLFIEKFKTNQNQNIIAILDKDCAGNKAKEELLNDYPFDEEKLNKNNYVKLKLLKNTYLLMLPKLERIKDNEYEIEDFFPLDSLLKIAKSQVKKFKVLKNFTLNKNLIKNKLVSECEKDSICKEDFNDFKKIFDLILEIKK